MPPISAVICAHVPDMLEAACRSVRWADEVLVVDNGAHPEVARIAREHADRHLRQPWLGFTGQLRFAVAAARHPWVFVLDRDEECSPELVHEIRSLDEGVLARTALFAMPRRHFMFGRRVRAWEPDSVRRLLHRDRTAWADEPLHSRCVPRPGGRTARLRGSILHRRTSDAGFFDFFNGPGMDERLSLFVLEMRQLRRPCRWYHVAFGPIAEFMKFYVLRLGILDGQFGLLIAYKAAYAVHLRYAALWAAQHGILRGGEPWPSPATSEGRAASEPLQHATEM